MDGPFSDHRTTATRYPTAVTEQQHTAHVRQFGLTLILVDGPDTYASTTRALHGHAPQWSGRAACVDSGPGKETVICGVSAHDTALLIELGTRVYDGFDHRP